MQTAAVFAERPRFGQAHVVLPAVIVLATGALWLGAGGWRQGALFLIGALLGMSLYHAAFGFTAAYRNAILYRDVSGIAAQLIMLGLALVLFAPVLADGQGLGRPAGGAVAPVGLRVALGSFIFGLGMQLGGGCGSGTLFTVGGGNARMVATLAAFCAGAFLGSLDAERWDGSWSLGSISLGQRLGFGVAMAVQLGLLALIWLGVRAWAGDAAQRPLWDRNLTWQRLLSGPWPLLLSAGLLALGNWLTLLIAGHAWSITWGFTLWGAKLALALGWDPATSGFWSGGFPQRALAKGVLGDVTSIMDLGIMLGALLAAGLGSRFAPTLRIPLRSLLAAVLGGLLMGYGARLAFGCNIGAFFSGVASFSLHGWVWIVFALAGTWLGVHLRPWFGLRN